MLRKNFFSVDELVAVVHDFRHAGLSEQEVALMAFAQKVALDPGSVTQPDVDGLRGFGLSDAEILDAVVACTARVFFSKTLDALDADPGETYQALEPELLDALAIGRAYP